MGRKVELNPSCALFTHLERLFSRIKELSSHNSDSDDDVIVVVSTVHWRTMSPTLTQMSLQWVT